MGVDENDDVNGKGYNDNWCVTDIDDGSGKKDKGLCLSVSTILLHYIIQEIAMS